MSGPVHAQLFCGNRSKQISLSSHCKYQSFLKHKDWTCS